MTTDSSPSSCPSTPHELPHNSAPGSPHGSPHQSPHDSPCESPGNSHNPLDEIGKGFGEFMDGVGEAVGDVAAEVVSKASEVLENLKEFLDDKFAAPLEIPWDKVPGEVLQYIKNNPTQVAFYTAGTALFFCPALFTFPLLSSLGFTVLGPALGSIAAMVQSTAGTPFFFRVLQSAAMGGGGAAIVANVARGVALSSLGAGAAVEWLSKNKQANDGDSEDNEDNGSGNEDS